MTGDLVWAMNKVRSKGKSPKMQMRWVGPLIILKCLNDVTYQAIIGEKEVKVTMTFLSLLRVKIYCNGCMAQ